MDNIYKSAKEKLLARFHLNALKSMIEEGLFSESASRDWAGSLVKLLEEQKKIEQSKQSTLISFIKRNE